MRSRTVWYDFCCHGDAYVAIPLSGRGLGRVLRRRDFRVAVWPAGLAGRLRLIAMGKRAFGVLIGAGKPGQHGGPLHGGGKPARGFLFSGEGPACVPDRATIVYATGPGGFGPDLPIVHRGWKLPAPFATMTTGRRGTPPILLSKGGPARYWMGERAVREIAAGSKGAASPI